MKERLADDCAYCRGICYPEHQGILFQENFCSRCRAAFALERIVELLEEIADAR